MDRDINSKTFSLATPRDLLAKLYSDLQDLSEAPAWNSATRVYRSIDCFLTLWHMADWFWVSLKRDPEAFSRWKTTHPEIDTVHKLKDWLCRECIAMRVAQQVATASKHLIVDRARDDPGINAELEREAAGRFTIPKDAVIKIDGKAVMVEAVVENGRDFWRRFLDKEMPEDEFFVGD